MQKIVGVTPADVVIISRQRGAVLDDVLAVDVRASPPRVSKLTVARRPDGDISEVVLSPQGDRLAWRTQSWSDVKGALGDWLAGLFRHRTRDMRTTCAVWVSRLDGTDMRQLGSERLTRGEEPDVLRWLPDGKALSFTANQGLYSVPTE